MNVAGPYPAPRARNRINYEEDLAYGRQRGHQLSEEQIALILLMQIQGFVDIEAYRAAIQRHAHEENGEPDPASR